MSIGHGWRRKVALISNTMWRCTEIAILVTRQIACSRLQDSNIQRYKTDADTDAWELTTEKAHSPLPNITRVLFPLDLVFSTSLLSEGLARDTRQIARKTLVKRILNASTNLANYTRNFYNIPEIPLSQQVAQL